MKITHALLGICASFLALASPVMAEQPEKETVPAATSSDFEARNASYSVVINGRILTGTAVNVKTSDASAGYLVTATAALSYQRRLEGIQSINVIDPSRNINRSVRIVTSDPRTGLTLLRTDGPLPRPVAVAASLPTVGSHVVACAVGTTRSCTTGTFLGTANLMDDHNRIIRVETRTDIDHLEGTTGAGVFTPTAEVNDSQLLGIVLRSKGAAAFTSNTDVNELLRNVAKK